MRWFHKFLISCLVLAVAGTALAKNVDKEKNKQKSGQKEKSGEKKKSVATDKKKSGDDSADGTVATQNEKGKITIPIVRGNDSKGLKIQYRDPQGKLQMVFVIGVARRLDDDRVQMEEMTVQTYDDDGNPEMTVDMPTSVFDLNTHVLTSNTSAKIKRNDFEVTGDSVAFNTDSKEGKLIGNVHMLIYDLNENDSKNTDEKKESAKDAH